MSKSWTYHYHAISQRPNGSIVNQDGIAVTNEPIVTDSQLDELRESISEAASIPGATITICSLTSLPTE